MRTSNVSQLLSGLKKIQSKLMIIVVEINYIGTILLSYFLFYYYITKYIFLIFYIALIKTIY